MTSINPGTNVAPQQTELPPGFVNENGEIDLQDPQVKQHLSVLFKDFFANHLSHADGSANSSSVFDEGPPAPGEKGASPSDFSGMYARFQAGGDTFEVGITQVMELLHEIGQEQKKTGTEMREAKRDAEFGKLMEGADKMREAAAFALAAGIASGATSIASGVISFAGAAVTAVVGIKGAMGAANAPAADVKTPGAPGSPGAQGGAGGGWQSAQPTGTAGKPMMGTHRPDATPPSAGWKNMAMNGLMTQSPVIQGVTTAASGLTDGVGKTVGAALEHAQAELQADQKELEAKAATDRANADEMNDMKQSALDLQREVRQKLGEINDINNRTMNRILQG